MTRVSAKYIRKLAKQYNIEITEHLRSKATKLKYIELIYDEMARQLARQYAKEQVENFIKTVQNSLNPKYYTTTNLDSFARKLDIFYIPEKRVIGTVSLGMIRPWFRTANQSKNVQVPAKDILTAVDAVVDVHISSIKKSIFA